MSLMMKAYSRRQLTRVEQIASYRISRDRMVVENAFIIFVSQFRVLLGIMEQRPRLFVDIVFENGVLQNMRAHKQGADNVPTLANYVAALWNKQVVYLPNENYRHPSREAKRQRELTKDYFSHVGALAGQVT